MKRYDYFDRQIRKLVKKSLHLRLNAKSVNAKRRLFWLYRKQALIFFQREALKFTGEYSSVNDFLNAYPAFSLAYKDWRTL